MRTNGRIGAIAQLLRRYLGHYSQSSKATVTRASREANKIREENKTTREEN